jgi:hypothetical protein
MFSESGEPVNRGDFDRIAAAFNVDEQTKQLAFDYLAKLADLPDLQVSNCFLRNT